MTPEERAAKIVASLLPEQVDRSVHFQAAIAAAIRERPL